MRCVQVEPSLPWHAADTCVPVSVAPAWLEVMQAPLTPAVQSELDLAMLVPLPSSPAWVAVVLVRARQPVPMHAAETSVRSGTTEPEVSERQAPAAAQVAVAFPAVCFPATVVVVLVVRVAQ